MTFRKPADGAIVLGQQWRSVSQQGGAGLRVVQKQSAAQALELESLTNKASALLDLHAHALADP